MERFILLLLAFCLLAAPSWGQSLPFDFEGDITTSDFVDFGGGTATVIPNPQQNTDNPSATVAQIVRDGGSDFAGSKIILSANLNFSASNTLTMKVYTEAPIGTLVKFKLEGNGATERDVFTTKTGEWETLTWDFTGTPTEFNEAVFMFDFGNVGNGTANSTFLFDDVDQIFGGFQIDLPVTFDDPDVNYTMTSFDGAISTLVTDPTDGTNSVMQVQRPSDAGGTAGTTIGTPGGFATAVPLSLTDSKMNVRVWSPDANIPIRLKLENANDPTQTVETQITNSVAGDWETLEFDFTNEANGTAPLSVGIANGWIYSKATIFFNFLVDPAGAGDKTYYFDDVQFGEVVVGINDPLDAAGFDIFPNPTESTWFVNSLESNMTRVELYDVQGRLLRLEDFDAPQIEINSSDLNTGIYILQITTPQGFYTQKLIKK